MKKLFIVLVAVILVIGMGACGNKTQEEVDPNIGIWQAVTVEDGDYSYEAKDAGFGDFTVELKSGGKCTVTLDGQNYNGTWKLEGNSLTLKAGLLTVTGMIENDRMKIENLYDLGLNVILFMNGAKPSGSTDSGGSEPTSGNLGSELSWWNGEFYGYWQVSSATGQFADWEGGVWDCYAVINVDSDATATMYVWDDEIDMATAKMSIDLGGGVASMGSARSEGGEAFRTPLKGGDWIILPTYEGYEDYFGNIFPDDYMELDATTDTDDGYVDYKIVLRPWGILWNDLPEDMRPPYYDSWYVDSGNYQLPSMLEAIRGTTIYDGEKEAHIHSALN